MFYLWRFIESAYLIICSQTQLAPGTLAHAWESYLVLLYNKTTVNRVVWRVFFLFDILRTALTHKISSKTEAENFRFCKRAYIILLVEEKLRFRKRAYIILPNNIHFKPRKKIYWQDSDKLVYVRQNKLNLKLKPPYALLLIYKGRKNP